MDISLPPCHGTGTKNLAQSAGLDTLPALTRLPPQTTQRTTSPRPNPPLRNSRNHMSRAMPLRVTPFIGHRRRRRPPFHSIDAGTRSGISIRNTTHTLTRATDDLPAQNNYKPRQPLSFRTTPAVLPALPVHDKWREKEVSPLYKPRGGVDSFGSEAHPRITTSTTAV